MFKRLAHRHRNPFGEIDLIFCRGDLLLFVEVKYRRGLGHKSKAFDDVEMLMPHPRQQDRLLKLPITIGTIIPNTTTGRLDLIWWLFILQVGYGGLLIALCKTTNNHLCT